MFITSAHPIHPAWRSVAYASNRAALCTVLVVGCLVATAEAQPQRRGSSASVKSAELNVSPGSKATHQLIGRQWNDLRDILVLENGRRSKAVTASLAPPGRSGRTLTVEVSATAQPGTKFQLVGVGTGRRTTSLPVRVVVAKNGETGPPARAQRGKPTGPAVQRPTASEDKEPLFADFGDRRLTKVDRLEVLDEERFRLRAGRRTVVVDTGELVKQAQTQLRRAPRAPRPWGVVARRKDGSRAAVQRAKLLDKDELQLVTENGAVSIGSPHQVEFVRDSDNGALQPVIMPDGTIVWTSGSGTVDFGSAPVSSSGNDTSGSDAEPNEPKAFDYFNCHLAGGGHSWRNSYLLAMVSDCIYPGTLVGSQSVTGSQFKAVFREAMTEFGIDGENITFVEHAGTGVYGAIMSTDDCTIVVFRGTELTAADWQTHAAFVPVHTPANYDAGIGFHGGWWVALDHVYHDLTNALQTNQHGGGRKLWLTGHSLGAVMAVTAAYRLTVDGIGVHGVATYGCPRPGNVPFQLAYEETGLTGRTHRWVNFRDLVTRIPTWKPHLPFTDGSLAPRHVGRSHLINADESVDLDFGGMIIEASFAGPFSYHGAYSRLIRDNMPDTSHMPPVP